MPDNSLTYNTFYFSTVEDELKIWKSALVALQPTGLLRFFGRCDAVTGTLEEVPAFEVREGAYGVKHLFTDRG